MAQSPGFSLFSSALPPGENGTPSDSDGWPKWSPWIAPVGLVLSFSLAVFGSVVIGAFAALGGAKLEPTPPSVLLAGTAFQDLALIGTALFFARLQGNIRLSDFGIRRISLATGLKGLTICWLVFFIFSAAFVGALGINDETELPAKLGIGDSTFSLICVILLLTVVAPVAEEFFFRGFFFTALRNWKGPMIAAIITGIVFGVIHLGSGPAALTVPLGVFGFLLCLLYWWSGSLLPCIVLHALNNSLALGVSQHWNWQIPAIMIGANLLIFLLLRPLLSPKMGTSPSSGYR